MHEEDDHPTEGVRTSRSATDMEAVRNEFGSGGGTLSQSGAGDSTGESDETEDECPECETGTVKEISGHEVCDTCGMTWTQREPLA